MQRVYGRKTVIARGSGEGYDTSTTLLWLEGVADILGSRPGVCCSCKPCSEVHPIRVEILDEVYGEGEEAKCWDLCGFFTLYVEDWVARFQVWGLKCCLGGVSMDSVQICFEVFLEVASLITCESQPQLVRVHAGAVTERTFKSIT